jgi:hypothetical protein
MASKWVIVLASKWVIVMASDEGGVSCSIAEELGRVKEAGQSAVDRGHSDFSLRVWTPPGGGDDGSGSDGSDEDEVHGNNSSPPQAM